MKESAINPQSAIRPSIKLRAVSLSNGNPKSEMDYYGDIQ